MKLILASTSPYRKAQLERLSLPFSTHSPMVDESKYKNEIFTPNELAKQLAFEKASAIFKNQPTSECTVIGGDQVLAFEDQILGKPEGVSGAVEQLLQLQAKEHQLITSICILSHDKRIDHTSVAKMKMRPLTEAEIIRYIEKDKPLNTCGSYKLEEAGITLFEKIDCDDYTSIIGMPLIFITGALKELGFATP